MTCRSVILRDLDDTRQLAEETAQAMPPRSLLLLDGPLGAGKTTFVQMLARAAGSDAAVTSPTYTLVHEYPTDRGTLVHIDAYRLAEPAALFDLGLEDYLDRAWLVVVEWGAPLRRHVPDAELLRFERRPDGTRRAAWQPPEATDAPPT